MAFDLYFKAQESTDRDTLYRHFSPRGYQVTDRQAIRHNEETGTYFWFDLEDPGPELGVKPGRLAPVSFHLNYFRPHSFALEAARELSALVEAFGLVIAGPALPGLARGAYSDEAFLEAWKRGNEAAYQEFLPHPELQDPPVLPAERMERFWRWNVDRKLLNELLEGSAAPPQVFFFRQEGAVRSFITWPNLAAAAIPTVDYLAIVRFDRKEDGSIDEQSLVRSFLPFEEVEPLLRDYELVQGPLPYYLLQYDSPPAELARFVEGLPPFEGQVEQVQPEDILDQKLVARYGGK